MRSSHTHRLVPARHGSHRPGPTLAAQAMSLGFALLPLVALVWAIWNTGLIRN